MVEKVSLKFDEDDLTIGDLEDFEEVAGVALFEALKPSVVKDDEGKPVRDETGRPVTAVDLSAKSLKALVWILLRRDRPGFTPSDARDIKVTSLDLGDADADEPDESGNDGEPEAAPAPDETE